MKNISKSRVKGEVRRGKSGGGNEIEGEVFIIGKIFCFLKFCCNKA